MDGQFFVGNKEQILFKNGDVLKIDFLIPNKKILDSCAKLFDEMIFGTADEAIYRTINKFPGNEDLRDVLVKVTMIVSLYGLVIYDWESMAIHISNISNLDELLDIGDLNAVNMIRLQHGIKNKNGTELNFYSFATKYCSAHNPCKYPIYDSMVARTIYNLNSQLNNSKPEVFEKLTWEKMNDYEIYFNTIHKYMNYFGFEQSDCKEFDKGFWIYSKYCLLKYETIKIYTKNDLQVLDEVGKFMK
jgi:hypothetical protein